MTNSDLWDHEIAARYDESSALMFSSEVLDPAVDFLADLAGQGAALELAIGTGRVAIPLTDVVCQAGVATAGPVDPDVFTDQVLQAGSFGELQNRREAGTRHEVGIIEDRRTDVTVSHLPDALRLWLNRSLDKTHPPTAHGHLAFTTGPSRQAKRWIRC